MESESKTEVTRGCRGTVGKTGGHSALAGDGGKVLGVYHGDGYTTL